MSVNISLILRKSKEVFEKKSDSFFNIFQKRGLTAWVLNSEQKKIPQRYIFEG